MISDELGTSKEGQIDNQRRRISVKSSLVVPGESSSHRNAHGTDYLAGVEGENKKGVIQLDDKKDEELIFDQLMREKKALEID